LEQFTKIWEFRTKRYLATVPIEGILKEEAFFNGKYHDQLTMAIFNKIK